MSISVRSLHSYPLKSGSAINWPSFNLTRRGLEFDRDWMIVKEPLPGEEILTFLTQRDRNCEKLALIQSDPDPEGIIFTVPDYGAIAIDHSELNPEASSARVHKSLCHVKDAGNKPALWISEFLGQPARIVRIDDTQPRWANPEYYGESQEVGLADGAPILVASTASLNYLQAHFRANSGIVTMDRFRANIVLDGLKAFEEDTIHQLRIGDQIVELGKPCDRCKIPTIDQQLGVYAGVEPNFTLRKFRQAANGKWYFGQNGLARTFGKISVGDKVEILSRREPSSLLDGIAFKFDVRPA